jgi:hypothetical protein
MVGMHDAASMVARCENQIEQLTQQVERFNGVAFNRGVVRAGAAVYERVSGDDRASLEAAAQLIRIGIANACHLVRAVKRFAPDVKKAVCTSPYLGNWAVMMAPVTYSTNTTACLVGATDLDPPREGYSSETRLGFRRLPEGVSSWN